MTQDQLRASLATLGLSQARAASLLGVTTDAVSKWCLGHRKIPGPVARLVYLLLWETCEPKIPVREMLESYRPDTSPPAAFQRIQPAP